MCGLSKKKMPYLYLIDEAIGLLNNEIRLVEWRIKYPEQFKSHFNKQPFSPLYLADKTNLIDIMEIISGLFLSKRIVYKNGKTAFLSDLSKAFEWVFNVDQWLRRRIRLCIWKSWKTPNTRIRNLIKCGVPSWQARRHGWNRGLWCIASSPDLSHALSNEKLRLAGYTCLMDCYKKYRS